MAMETISNAAQTGLNTLVALAGSTDATQLRTAALTMRDVLDQFTDAANTSVNGEYVLAGIDTDNKPIGSYSTDERGAKTAFDNAFLGYFGFTQTDPLTSTITPTQMQDFMDNTVEPMFMTTGGDWEALWSDASDTPMTSRISQTEVVQTSATANATGFRYMAMAAVVGIELMNLPVTSDTRAVVTDSAIKFMGQAINGVDSERSQLGLSENRVKQANETLQAQINIIKLNLDDLEGVDVYAASTKITTLSNQMEISYNLTARLAQLSLVNEL
jgi:flagellar hook-associated protein 3 FlgL